MKIAYSSFQGVKACLAILLSCLLALGPGLGDRVLAANEQGQAPITIHSASTGGFHISGKTLLDANGNKFVMRGINHPHNWYSGQTSSFRNIKAMGANTIRVVLSDGHRFPKNSAADVANVINLCKTNKLVCVLEVHDTTGYKSDPAAGSLAEAAAYWKEIKSVLIGQEAYVMINIGNEPWGNTGQSGWITDTKNAILELRNAGFQHTLIVDAPYWGQDTAFVMRDNAAGILASDPAKNTIFSVHMYGGYDTADKVESYLSSFVKANLPLIIGEFGYRTSNGGPNEDAILQKANTYQIGYLAWSWSGNSNPILDMVTKFDPNQETWWGTRIIHGADGLLETSQECHCYNSTFADVPVNYWAREYIERLRSAGVTDGCNISPSMYCPTTTVTRDQMAVFLLRGKHGSSYSPPLTTGVFTDLPTGYWAAAWIEQLAAEGITGGCGKGNYCPASPVTRDQMAVFLLKARHGASYLPPPPRGVFLDVPTNHWAAAWIEQLAAEGITGGCGNGNYCPASPVTRDQMAVFLVRNFSLP